MIDEIGAAPFWVAIAKIVWIDVLLSGDNAVVIALAARNLPPARQRQAVILGSAGAIVLRVLLVFFAVALLTLPWVKLAGAALLLWIGIQLLKGDDAKPGIDPAKNLFAAVRTILVADFVMSLDNVLAVAAVAETAPESSRLLVLLLGLGLTIPLIMFGSTLLLRLIERFPLIVTAGAALLGFVAGEMAASDPVVRGLLPDTDWLPQPCWAWPAPRSSSGSASRWDAGPRRTPRPAEPLTASAGSVRRWRHGRASVEDEPVWLPGRSWIDALRRPLSSSTVVVRSASRVIAPLPRLSVVPALSSHRGSVTSLRDARVRRAAT